MCNQTQTRKKTMSKDTLYGPMDMPNWPEDLIVQALCDFGEWSAKEAALFARLLPENAVLWDCGAFLGSFTLGVARHRALSSVLAVEANAALVPFLARNLTRLAPCPVTVLSGGVGPQTGSLRPKAQDEIAQNHGAQVSEMTKTNDLLVLRRDNADYIIGRYEDMSSALTRWLRDEDICDILEFRRENTSGEKSFSKQISEVFKGGQSMRLQNLFQKTAYSQRFGYQDSEDLAE
ncbi:hypothetical protein [Pseudophaeobacter leonis]|uniref:hypothetical protein n=1 Tax=Pseudophaeobacter leonis TaxID=1144477 RepID=UPI0009F5A09F|nr:hypothetical protein [Pseudophaeobacter leonis]